MPASTECAAALLSFRYPSLNKLSPQELLAYAQNLVKQEKSKPLPKSKPVKSIIIKPCTKLSQILSSSGKALNYPQKIVLIAQMRDGELNMTSAPGKLKLTFAELFERRLKAMPGKKTKIQITVLAEVRYTIGSTSELESKEWGPFHISIPKLTNPSSISVHAYTATYTKFMSYIRHAPDFVLIFFLKDHHVHPITDPELNKVASSKNLFGTIDLFEYMSELKWTRRHDKFTMYDNLTPETQNNMIMIMIVCPEDLDVRTAICQYMQTSGYYVEYMHFNNNGKLNGFLDHKK